MIAHDFARALRSESALPDDIMLEEDTLTYSG